MRYGVGGMKVDFDKILQSFVTTLEHPVPFCEDGCHVLDVQDCQGAHGRR